MELEPFRRFAVLKTEYAKAEATKKRLRSEMDALQETLIGTMIQEGLNGMPIDVPGVGSVLLSTRTSLFAGPKDGDVETLHRVLIENGMGEMIRESVNRQTLSRLVRESREEDGDPLPPEVEAAITVGEKIEIAMRKRP